VQNLIIARANEECEEDNGCNQVICSLPTACHNKQTKNSGALTCNILEAKAELGPLPYCITKNDQGVSINGLPFTFGRNMGNPLQ
jgi:hypothetical protein